MFLIFGDCAVVLYCSVDGGGGVCVCVLEVLQADLSIRIGLMWVGATDVTQAATARRPDVGCVCVYTARMLLESYLSPRLSQTEHCVPEQCGRCHKTIKVVYGRNCCKQRAGCGVIQPVSTARETPVVSRRGQKPLPPSVKENHRSEGVWCSRCSVISKSRRVLHCCYWCFVVLLLALMHFDYNAPAHRAEALSDDACLTSLCRVHRA